MGNLKKIFHNAKAWMATSLRDVGTPVGLLGTLTSCQAKLSENHQVLSRQPRLRVLGLVPSNIEVQEWLSVLLTTGFFQPAEIKGKASANPCNILQPNQHNYV